MEGYVHFKERFLASWNNLRKNLKSEGRKENRSGSDQSDTTKPG